MERSGRGEPDLSRARADRRDLALALTAGALGALGAVPIVAGGRAAATSAPDPLALFAWLALVAPALGCALAGQGLSRPSFLIAVPGTWMVAVALVGATSPRDLPSPLWASLAVAGLYFAGAALGRAFRGRALELACALLLATALLAALPGRKAWSSAPWPPRTASILLDLSPITWVAESAGVDWMRHPSVYDPAETDRFERAAFRGSLAGPMALVLGCAAWLAASRATRAGGGSRPTGGRIEP